MNTLLKKNKILFVLPSFESGGAEKVAQLILENIDRKKFNLTAIIFSDIVKLSLPCDISLKCLNKKSRYDFSKIIWRLFHIINEKRPDIVVSFLTYANLISLLSIKLFRHKAKLVLTVHNMTSEMLKNEKLGWLKAWLIRKLYPYCEKVISVSEGSAKDLVDNFNVSKNRVKVIYNPVALDKIQNLAEDTLDHPWFKTKDLPIIISVGRLTKQKGQAYLLKAFYLVRKEIPCRLIILGDGEDREMLEKLSAELKIDNDVAFLGFQINPFNFIAYSDIFVLSSLWEGFGNVIIEAMACGTPVIATKCPSGPDEIITHGVNGFLVSPGSEKALAKSILILLSDKDLKKRYSEAGRKRVLDFQTEGIIAKYEKVFEDICKS